MARTNPENLHAYAAKSNEYDVTPEQPEHPTSAVEDALDELTQKRDQLDAFLRILLDRLDPVLRPNHDKETQMSPTPARVMASQVVSRITCESDQLMYLRSQIEAILSRLEV